MATVSKESYLRLLENRPYKFDAEEVDYRDAIVDAKYDFLQTDEPRCETCVHFYTRKVDGHNTCEIFRPADDSSVEPEYLCDFWTDGKETTPKDKTSSSERD
jgi:hypothetical protein